MNHLRLKLMAGLMVAASSLPVLAGEVTVARFFGACDNAGSDPTASTGEACIIQSILNATTEADNGIVIKTRAIDWGTYYDQLKTSYAGGTPPDVHVMHRHRVSEFAGLGALADLTDDLQAYGIDPNDWTQAALDAVTHNGRIVGVPMDLHANLWHVNMDVMAKAGLVEDGRPILPSSPEEMLAHAKQVKEATGLDYITSDFTEMVGARLVLALLWQQNANIFTADNQATINTLEAKRAVDAITQLFDNELANPETNYADAQQRFLNGEAAILVNGTWVVDFYDAEAKKEEVPLDYYYVADFPTLFEEGATWADSHMWAIPASLKAKNPEVYADAVKVLASIDEHNIDWARTGHMAVRKSVLESETYNNLPHRDEYAQTSAKATDSPAAVNYGAIQEALVAQLRTIWLIDAPIEEALEIAEQDVQDLLDR